MTTVLPDTAHRSTAPPELLRGMLEEEFAAQTELLTRLTMYSRLPRHAGFDPHTLEVRAAAARQRIADAAHALQRMSEGTYGTCADCHRPIPPGRLRAAPAASLCRSCERAPGAGR